jgi:hypothetical protein
MTTTLYATRCTECVFTVVGEDFDCTAAEALTHELDGHRTQLWPLDEDGIARPLPREMWAEVGILSCGCVPPACEGHERDEQ